MLYLAFLLHAMNYLELVESFDFGLTASWKVQDEREEYIFSSPFPRRIRGPFRRAVWDLSALHRSGSKDHAPVKQILLEY